jgi:hypothetical protein
LSYGSSSACHAVPVRHSGSQHSSTVVSIAVVSIAAPVVSIAAPVVSIAVVNIAAVSIAEPHHVMRLHCWVGLKRKLSFSYFREKFLLASRTQIYLQKHLQKQKIFTKTKIFAKAKMLAKSENDSAPYDYGSATLLSCIVISCNFYMLMKRVRLGMK